MRKFYGLLAVIVFALTVSIPGYAAQKAIFHATWDDRFLYIACEVQDPDIVSTNVSHMSEPWKDDGIEAFVDTSAAQAADRVAGTYQMSVSAGGGSSWLIGENGQAVPKKIYSFKYAAKVQGTINDSDDSDIGYVVEMALPWSEMGITPRAGTSMGFNILWLSKGEGDGFVSLSPQVKAESEVQVPAKWGKIELVDNASAPIVDGVVQSPLVKDSSPVVDGVLGTDEWARGMGFQLAKPENVLSSAAAQTVSPTSRQHPSIGKLICAVYSLDYQGEIRKTADSPSLLWGPDGASTLKHHPLEAPGPWYSSDRVQWEKDQLQGAAHAGIDVLLVSEKANPDSRTFSDSLSALVQGMRDLKSEKVNCPSLGLRLDLSGAQMTKESLYSSISGFFERVPDEFLAAIQKPAEKGLESCYILDVENFDPNTDWSSVREYCDKRMSDEFGGRHLIWISEKENDSLDSGWIRTSAISPVGPDSEACTAAWSAALTKSFDWLIINSWNDLRAGTEICPTMEFGDKYLDISRIGIIESNGKHPWHAKFLHQDTPSVMAPGGMYQVNFTVKNSGRKPWYTEDAVFLAGRWFKDGFLFADSGARVLMQNTILAGQSVTSAITIFALDQDHKPLTAGDYQLRWEMVRGTNEWFSNDGDLPVIVPVKIGEASPAFTLVSSTLPARMKPGVAYTAHVKVRNDGPAAWKAGDAKIGYRFGTTGEFTVGSPLIANVDAGRISDIIAAVTLPDGASDGSVSRLHWGIFDGKTWVPVSAGDAGESVQAVSSDPKLRFIATDTMKSMSAGIKYGADIVVQNESPNTWLKDSVSIGYHWYRIDGTEAVWEGEKSPIPSDVLPGGRLLVKAAIVPPQYDGEYFLVWDVWSNGKWGAASLDTCGNSMLVVPVSIRNGKLLPVSINSAYNDLTIVQSGGALPLELGPPFVTESPRTTSLWPSDLWATPKDDAETSIKRISFEYPLRVAGSKNVVSCQGQTISLKSGAYKAVHVLAVTSTATDAEFFLDYAGVRSASSVKMTGWNTAPTSGEYTGFRSDSASGTAFYVKHYVLPANPASSLTGLVLPKNSDIKILAISLERADN